jgi:hypothetical protein
VTLNSLGKRMLIYVLDFFDGGEGPPPLNPSPSPLESATALNTVNRTQENFDTYLSS